MIDLLHLLVKYGYYANLADIKSLMPLLISLLDGLNDKPSIQFSKDELEDFTKVLIVHDILTVYSYIFGRLVVSKTQKKIDLFLT